MKVKATDTGYYGDQLYREGDEFDISDESAFSEAWMEKVRQTRKKAADTDEESEG